MNQKGGLGRGLSNLLSTEDIFDAEAPGFFLCPIEKIRPNPNQPRIKIDPDSLDKLAESIKSKGIIQPLVVSESEDGNYIIIAGERRWRAAQKAGLTKVPVIIKDYSPQEMIEIALIENIQRKDLNPLEEALAYQKMVNELGLSQSEIASRVGKERSTIANMIRLLGLPDDIQKDLLEERITTGHAKVLLMLEDDEQKRLLRDKIIEQGLSVRRAEEIARAILSKKGQKKEKRPDPNIEHLSNQLSQIFNATVKVVPGKRGGKIEIRCSSKQDLERVIELFRALEDMER